jgi:LysM domain-containing protein
MHRGAIASPVLLLLASVVVTACIQSVARGGPSAAPSGLADSGFAASPSAPPPTGPTPVPSFVRPTPTPAPTFLVYVVKSGDNLDRIARRFGTTGRSIAYWNRGTYPSLDPEAAGYSPNLVKVGWTLMLIPKVILDEQTLGQPTPNPTDPAEATASPSD